MISLDHVIDFPNHSRSYDPTRRAVRFWGHDSAIEASFFINGDAFLNSVRFEPRFEMSQPGSMSAAAEVLMI